MLRVECSVFVSEKNVCFFLLNCNIFDNKAVSSSRRAIPNVDITRAENEQSVWRRYKDYNCLTLNCLSKCRRISVCVDQGWYAHSVTVLSAEEDRKERSLVCHRHWITLSPCSATTVTGRVLVRSPGEKQRKFNFIKKSHKNITSIMWHKYSGIYYYY